jgi:hypothetical protein
VSPISSIAYQWQESTNNSTWTDISGSTSSTLTLASVPSGKNGYYYRCNLQSLLSNIYSNSAMLTVNSAFTATAVLLTSGSSYTVPANATTMKAWVIGGGGSNGSTNWGGAGGCAYKTWSVTGGSSIAMVIGSGGPKWGANNSVSGAGGNTTITYGGVTITGQGGTQGGGVNGNNYAGGGFSGGDGGANGGTGNGSIYTGTGDYYGGAVGGNGASTGSCKRRVMTDISGLKAALTLAGISTTETCATSAAFGSGGAGNKLGSVSAGYGGGGAMDNVIGNWPTAQAGGNGAIVLYFT